MYLLVSCVCESGRSCFLQEGTVMESFFIALSVVGPLVVYMLIGIMLRRLNICSAGSFREFNQVLFRVFIPLSLFFSASSADVSETIQPVLFLGIEAGIIGMTVVSWHLLRKRIPDARDHATVIQGINRSNFVLFGGMVAASLCDERGVALTAALSAFVVPTVNIIGVVLFEHIRGGKITPARLLKAILRNPLVIAGMLGMLFAALHLRLPSLLEQPLMKLGNSATPVAMVVLGGLLSFRSIEKHRKLLTIAVIGKLLVLPLIAVTAGMLAGYHGNEMVAILAVFGAPTAVASAPMAQSMGGNGELAGEIVAATSVVSLLTMFVYVLILSATGWI